MVKLDIMRLQKGHYHLGLYRSSESARNIGSVLPAALRSVGDFREEGSWHSGDSSGGGGLSATLTGAPDHLFQGKPELFRLAWTDPTEESPLQFREKSSGGPQ